MKKILSLFVILAMCLSMTACTALADYFGANKELANDVEEKPHLSEPTDPETTEREEPTEKEDGEKEPESNLCANFEVVEIGDDYIMVAYTIDSMLSPVGIKVPLEGEILWENRQLGDILEVVYESYNDKSEIHVVENVKTIKFIQNKYDYSDVNLQELDEAGITVQEVLDKLKAHNEANAENNKTFCDIDIDMIRNYNVQGMNMVGKLLCNIEEKYEQNSVAAFGDCYLRVFMSVDAPDNDYEQVVMYEEEALDVRADKENDKIYYQSNLDPKWKVNASKFSEKSKVQIEVIEVKETVEELKVFTDGKYYILPFNAIIGVVNEGEELATTKMTQVYIVTDKNVSGYMLHIENAALDMDISGSVLVDAMKQLGDEGFVSDESVLSCSYTKGFYGLVGDDLIIDESIKERAVVGDTEAPGASDGNVE